MDRQITRKKSFAWTVATVLTPLAVSWMASGIYIGAWYARTRHQGPPLSGVLMQGFMLGTVIGLWATICLFWFTQRKETAFTELFATSSRNLPVDLMIGLCFGAALVAVYGVLDVVAFGAMFVFDGAKLMSLPATFSAGFCEEFLFRGFLFLAIARAGGGVKSQIVWTSVAFGLAHVFWGPWGMLWTTVLGGTLALIRVSRGNVWPAIVAHTVLNLCIEPALIDKAMSGGFG